VVFGVRKAVKVLLIYSLFFSFIPF